MLIGLEGAAVQRRSAEGARRLSEQARRAASGRAPARRTSLDQPTATRTVLAGQPGAGSASGVGGQS